MKTIRYPFFLIGSAFGVLSFASVQAIAGCPKNIPLTVLEKILGSKMENDRVKPVIQGGYVYELKVPSLTFEALRVKLSSKTALSAEFPSYASLSDKNETKTVLDPFTIGVDVKAEFQEEMGGSLCGYKMTRSAQPIYKGSDRLVVFKVETRQLPTLPASAAPL